ncbi:MAG: MBL fold metallo-hydrolase [Candidatus Helarchaeota archaeon]|nr:MBL fold metallo-hydrolase [Candidatus Helarchaeota archaeon]
MKKNLKVTFLGTGTSLGVPEIGCKCEVCTSPDMKNKRLRPSVLIEAKEISILIDTTPDLRIQALKYNVNKIDAVLYTHQHADHIFGLDDIRRFNYIQKRAIPCYGSENTIKALMNSFSYILKNDKRFEYFLPKVDFHTINNNFYIRDIEIIPVEVLHGGLSILGFRIGDFAYLTDCNKIPNGSRELLSGLNVLVLDALRKKPHIAHFNLSEAVSEARLIGAERTFFTHISHDLEHNTINKQLPENIKLAYDGLVVEL